MPASFKNAATLSGPAALVLWLITLMGGQAKPDVPSPMIASSITIVDDKGKVAAQLNASGLTVLCDKDRRITLGRTDAGAELAFMQTDPKDSTMDAVRIKIGLSGELATVQTFAVNDQAVTLAAEKEASIRVKGGSGFTRIGDATPLGHGVVIRNGADDSTLWAMCKPQGGALISMDSKGKEYCSFGDAGLKIKSVDDLGCTFIERAQSDSRIGVVGPHDSSTVIKPDGIFVSSPRGTAFLGSRSDSLAISLFDKEKDGLHGVNVMYRDGLPSILLTRPGRKEGLSLGIARDGIPFAVSKDDKGDILWGLPSADQRASSTKRSEKP